MIRALGQLRPMSTKISSLNVHEMPGYFDVLIVGGGAAGINLAHRYKAVLEDLRQVGDKRKIGIVEPSLVSNSQNLSDSL